MSGLSQMAQSEIPRFFIYCTMFVCILATCIGKLNASESVYSVDNIMVDLSAASSAEARAAALEKAQFLAFKKLCDRLVIAEDIQFLEDVSLQDIEGMIESYVIKKELLSSVRYMAKLIFYFNSNAVSAFLKVNQIRFAEAKSKERLVIPILELPNGEQILWQEPRDWSNSWLVQANDAELVPLIVPLGDITDIDLISAKTEITPSWETFSPLAKRYEVEDVIIVSAKVMIRTYEDVNNFVQKNLELENKKLDDNPVSKRKKGRFLRRASDRIVLIIDTHFVNALKGKQQRVELESLDGENFNEILLRGANKIAQNIQETWKKDNVLNFGLENAIQIAIPLSHLRDWVQIREKLSRLAVIKHMDIISISRYEAELKIDYLGEVDQLVTALKQLNLHLSYGLEGWLLQNSNG